MSYVLDALRKAEKDRRNQPDLGLHNLDQDEWNKPPDSNKNSPFNMRAIWVLPCLVCISIVAFQFRPVVIEEVETTTSIASEQGLPIVVAEDPITDRVILLSESPAETIQTESGENLATRISKFRFEGNLYIEGNPTGSRVFIDGGAYKMGDALEGDIYLVAIDANSVTLSDGYDQIIQPLR